VLLNQRRFSTRYEASCRRPTTLRSSSTRPGPRSSAATRRAHSDGCPTIVRVALILTASNSTAFHCVPLHSSAFHRIPKHSKAFHCILLLSVAFHFIPSRSTAFHYIPLHSIALHCFLLRSTAFHCILLRPTLFYYIPLHYTAFHCIPPHSAAFYCISLLSTAFRCFPPHSTAFHCISLRSTAFHCIPLLPTEFHRILLHSTAYRCILSHSTAFYCTPLHSTALNFAALHLAPIYSLALQCIPLSTYFFHSLFLPPPSISPLSDLTGMIGPRKTIAPGATLQQPYTLIEMGGASAQVTQLAKNAQEAASIPMANRFTFESDVERLEVYTHSYLGFGAEAAREKLNQWLLKSGRAQVQAMRTQMQLTNTSSSSNSSTSNSTPPVAVVTAEGTYRLADGTVADPCLSPGMSRSSSTPREDVFDGPAGIYNVTSAVSSSSDSSGVSSGLCLSSMKNIFTKSDPYTCGLQKTKTEVAKKTAYSLTFDCVRQPAFVTQSGM
jgi:hypothetical protein